MPQKWLQVKGDPSVRAFLFQQSRVESQFDSELDRIHGIVQELLIRKGAFHVKIHYSSSALFQRIFWFTFPNNNFLDRSPIQLTRPFICRFRSASRPTR